MRGPVNAYKYLLSVAEGGRDYTNDDVLDDLSDVDPAAKFGVGRDFEADVQVPAPDGAELLGKAALRLVCTEGGNLFLRTKLGWRIDRGVGNEYGGDYNSYARYTITKAGALALAEQISEPLPAEHRFSWAKHMQGAVWLQSFPGSFLEVLAESASGRYHRQAVQTAQAASPELLAMLSTTDKGQIRPNELDLLAAAVEKRL